MGTSAIPLIIGSMASGGGTRRREPRPGGAPGAIGRTAVGRARAAMRASAAPASGTWLWWALLTAAAGARELDPATCAPRFEVQRDKIIRTEESRAMGARYLSELDVGTRQECLHLCCETDACDVFVYDEKVLWRSLRWQRGTRDLY